MGTLQERPGATFQDCGHGVVNVHLFAQKLFVKCALVLGIAPDAADTGSQASPSTVCFLRLVSHIQSEIWAEVWRRPGHWLGGHLEEEHSWTWRQLVYRPSAGLYGVCLQYSRAAPKNAVTWRKEGTGKHIAGHGRMCRWLCLSFQVERGPQEGLTRERRDLYTCYERRTLPLCLAESAFLYSRYLISQNQPKILRSHPGCEGVEDRVSLGESCGI